VERPDARVVHISTVIHGRTASRRIYSDQLREKASKDARRNRNPLRPVAPDGVGRGGVERVHHRARHPRQRARVRRALRPHVASGVHRIILIPYRYQPEQIEIAR